MKKLNILITSAGVATAINVIDALKQSLLYTCKIIATDMNEHSAGLYMADKYYLTPSADADDFLPMIVDIIKKEKIDFIFPLHSSETELFSKNISVFKELDCGINIPDVDVVKTCTNKDLFELFLDKNGFKHPKTYKNISEIKDFPVFIKPKVGSSSKGAMVLHSKKDFDYFVKGKEEHIMMQEYMSCDEITIDCYVNANHKLVAFVPRYRVKVKDGKSVVARTMYDEELLEQTKRLLKALKYKGACNIQVFYNKAHISFIELNPRLAAGGLPLATKAGVNIPELMMKDYFDKVSDELIKYNHNLTMYRYLSQIFK